MATQIIGMIGQKRSGKDTFAEALVEHRGFTRVAFADPMKDAAVALDPYVKVPCRDCAFNCGQMIYRRLSDEVAEYGWDVVKETRDVRRTLQRLGTEMGRGMFGDDFWVTVALREIEKIPGPVVVTDVRFPNEADAVRRAGGRTVRVTRPGLSMDDTHASETALSDFAADFTVSNTGTIADLHRSALSLIF